VLERIGRFDRIFLEPTMASALIVFGHPVWVGKRGIWRMKPTGIVYFMGAFQKFRSTMETNSMRR
jgi:hypothetical protein